MTLRPSGVPGLPQIILVWIVLSLTDLLPCLFFFLLRPAAAEKKAPKAKAPKAGAAKAADQGKKAPAGQKQKAVAAAKATRAGATATRAHKVRTVPSFKRCVTQGRALAAAAERVES